MKIVFFGSSDFSLQALQACLDHQLTVSLVITTPPQKKGRGLIETPTPVEGFAKERQLSVINPAHLKSPELLQQIQQLAPEIFVAASYGKIIPAEWLKIPSKAALNVHPSLLPKYRGAAPIHWPILLGDQETGISIAELTPGLDAGDIFYRMKYAIPPDGDAQAMTDFLGKKSYDALRVVLKQIQEQKLQRTPQDHNKRNYARKLTKEDSRVDWNRSAAQLHNQIRGLLPWPTASINFSGEPLQLLKSRVPGTVVPGTLTSASGGAGEILKIEQEAVHVQTGNGILVLLRVKPSGKKEMTAGDFVRGRRLNPGFVFESAFPPDFHLKQDYQ